MSKLLIVESPTKAKTITKFLGKDYIVLSSFGHVRDLPKSDTGVDTKHDFKPTYEVPTKAKKAVTALKKAAKTADEVYFATDHDREGEAIAWHIAELLKIDAEKVKRITFHEITKKAIEEAVSKPHALDINLVNAQQARRILDRLVGYELSPLLWQTIRYGLSAGRVQSVALRLIVERERERNAFKSEEYWSLDAKFEKDKIEFEGKLQAIDGKKVDKMQINNEADAKAIHDDLTGALYAVTKIEKKQTKKSPPPPFTTSSMQIEGNNKLHMSAKQTMRAAQILYETGHITYMRTDSTNLAGQFLAAAQEFIGSEFGSDYATGPKTYKTKKKGAQEAHEAIRPTHIERTPELMKGKIKASEWKLYDLIWRRALASQLPQAVLNRESVNITAKKYTFRSTGSSIHFDGYMKVYRSAKEKILPELNEGDKMDKAEVTPNQHFTEPPARFSDATLVKVLEEHEIGRPSTYAPTISTIIDREYVERDDNKKLSPTDTGYTVTDMLKEHFPNIVDYEFTSDLENKLDKIAEGEQEWVPMLKDFYTPFHKLIEDKSKNLKREDVVKDRELGKDPKSGLEILVRGGRFGSYLQLGPTPDKEDEKAKKPKTISIPKGMAAETITLEEALDLLALPRMVGTYEGEEIAASIGRFGPYLKAGKATASIPEDKNPLTITEEEAQALLKEAVEFKKKAAEPLGEFGEDPESKEPILLKTGRFGPYITDGKTNASLGKKYQPEDITREIAIELLEKKRARNAAKKK